MLKRMSWEEFRSCCKDDAVLWRENGYTADELTAEDVINEYGDLDEYFTDGDLTSDDIFDDESLFSPEDFAKQTLKYLCEIEEEEEEEEY